MFRVNVPKIFEIARIMSLMEPFFSKVTRNYCILQLCSQLYHVGWYVSISSSSRNFGKLPFTRSCRSWFLPGVVYSRQFQTLLRTNSQSNLSKLFRKYPKTFGKTFVMDVSFSNFQASKLQSSTLRILKGAENFRNKFQKQHIWSSFSKAPALKGCQYHRYSKLLSGKFPGRLASVPNKYSSRNGFLGKFLKIFETANFSKYK